MTRQQMKGVVVKLFRENLPSLIKANAAFLKIRRRTFKQGISVGSVETIRYSIRYFYPKYVVQGDDETDR